MSTGGYPLSHGWPKMFTIVAMLKSEAGVCWVEVLALLSMKTIVVFPSAALMTLLTGSLTPLAHFLPHVGVRLIGSCTPASSRSSSVSSLISILKSRIAAIERNSSVTPSAAPFLVSPLAGTVTEPLTLGVSPKFTTTTSVASRAVVFACTTRMTLSRVTSSDSCILTTTANPAPSCTGQNLVKPGTGGADANAMAMARGRSAAGVATITPALGTLTSARTRWILTTRILKHVW
mmetsp:Transcript_7796/g.11001  ORF Transcript_7796/g.11001 Transcript_7796/m.11001 type:complete len:234 (+) Transcript_7796:555-1256(+)